MLIILLIYGLLFADSGYLYYTSYSFIKVELEVVYQLYSFHYLLQHLLPPIPQAFGGEVERVVLTLMPEARSYLFPRCRLFRRVAEIDLGVGPGYLYTLSVKSLLEAKPQLSHHCPLLHRVNITQNLDVYPGVA